MIIVLCAIVLCLAGCSDDPSGPGGARDDDVLLEDAHFPSWSPDGSALICNRSAPHLERSVWWITPSGSESRLLFTDATGEYGPWFPQWMPDGRHIVYHRTKEGTSGNIYEFVIHDLDGGDPVVWEVPEFWHDAAFKLVPDGSEVLFTYYDQGDWIGALDLRDGTTRVLREGVGAAASPDLQWMVWSQDDSIRVAPFAGGQSRGLGVGWQAAWTPDSQYVVFSGPGATGDPDLIIVSRDGSYRNQLTDDPAWDLRPAVSPQGDRVAYVKSPDNDDGPFSLRIIELDLE